MSVLTEVYTPFSLSEPVSPASARFLTLPEASTFHRIMSKPSAVLVMLANLDPADDRPKPEKLHDILTADSLDGYFNTFEEQLDGLILPADMDDRLAYAEMTEDYTTGFAAAARKDSLVVTDPDLRWNNHVWEFEEVQFHARILSIIRRQAHFTAKPSTPSALHPPLESTKKTGQLGNKLGELMGITLEKYSAGIATIAEAGIALAAVVGLLNELTANAYYRNDQKNVAAGISDKSLAPKERVAKLRDSRDFQQSLASRALGSIGSDEFNKHGATNELFAFKLLNGHRKHLYRTLVSIALRVVTAVGVDFENQSYFDEISYTLVAGKEDRLADIAKGIDATMRKLPGQRYATPAERILMPAAARAGLRRI